MYDPRDWFWIVGGDEGRAWSSAAGAYVAVWPADSITRIASEAELNDVLAVYGMRGPLVTTGHVRAEAQRRVIALTGARDLTSCLIKQLNANMRANELNDKRVSGAALTQPEEAEAAALRGLAEGIKAIRAASNAMEQSPPSDYAANGRWPS